MEAQNDGELEDLHKKIRSIRQVSLSSLLWLLSTFTDTHTRFARVRYGSLTLARSTGHVRYL